LPAACTLFYAFIDVTSAKIRYKISPQCRFKLVNTDETASVQSIVNCVNIKISGYVERHSIFQSEHFDFAHQVLGSRVSGTVVTKSNSLTSV
jgi:hypothetical protein